MFLSFLAPASEETDTKPQYQEGDDRDDHLDQGHLGETFSQLVDPLLCEVKEAVECGGLCWHMFRDAAGRGGVVCDPASFGVPDFDPRVGVLFAYDVVIAKGVVLGDEITTDDTCWDAKCSREEGEGRGKVFTVSLSMCCEKVDDGIDLRGAFKGQGVAKVSGKMNTERAQLVVEVVRFLCPFFGDLS